MRIIRFALAVLAFAAAGAHAQDKSCTPAQSAAAEKAMDRVVNWDLMYKTWQEHGNCDTGMSEDVFTDALMRLAVEWKNVDQFVEHGDPQVLLSDCGLDAPGIVRAIHQRLDNAGRRPGMAA